MRNIKGVPDASLCYCTPLRRGARAVTNAYDAALKDTGLTVAQLALLRGLLRIGTPTITEASNVLALDRTTLGRNLRLLETAGFVEQRIGEDDKRSRRIFVTASGLRMVRKGYAAWEATQSRLEAAVGAASLRQLKSLLAIVEKAAVNLCHENDPDPAPEPFPAAGDHHCKTESV